MSKERKNYTLDADVTNLLEEVGNASEYIETAVRARAQAWRSALACLMSRGWIGPELLAACDVLNGYALLDPFSSPATFVAAELADGEALNGICGKWDVTPKRWKAHAKRLSENELEARALITLAAEFWSGNAACEAAIRRVTGQ